MPEAAQGAGRHRAWRFGFAVFMLALTALFVALGLWQVGRLSEKETQLAAIEARQDAPAISLPLVADWPALDASSLDYQPVTLRGAYRGDQTVLVFTSLGEARGQYSGAGYWVMTPLALEAGGTVFVNRGFVPQARGTDYLGAAAAPQGVVEVTGLARLPEPGNSFTPAADAGSRIGWIRNVEELAGLTDPGLAPFAPVYVDATAGGVGELPQGGETMLTLTNRHLEYALTWFSLALITPLLLGYWLWRDRRARA